MGTKVFSSPALGIAKGGLAMIEENLRWPEYGWKYSMAELPTAQVRISEAGAEIDAAEALLLKDCADAMAIAETGSLPEISLNALPGAETMHTLLSFVYERWSDLTRWWVHAV